MELKKVMVIGAGQMGSGIAQVMAAHGVEVVLRDIKQEFVDRGIKNIEKKSSTEPKKHGKTETCDAFKRYLRSLSHPLF